VSHQGRQTRDISWWPKPSAWEISGLNIGFWSADCEAWFQRRVQDIGSGTAELRSPSQWKQSLRFAKTCNDTARIVDDLSAQFLAL
jgi:hypothetical protein